MRRPSPPVLALAALVGCSSDFDQKPETRNQKPEPGNREPRTVNREPSFRPPAVPLIACDPYFSVWSAADRLFDDWTRHWTGKTHALCSLVRVDGKPYRLMGRSVTEVHPMPQVGLTVHPTRTIYDFEADGVRITLTFLTASFPHDLDLLSWPVAWIEWSARATDGKTHSVAVYFDHSAELVVNVPEQKVTWDRAAVEGMRVLTMGSEEQAVLAKKGDDLRIDWGRLYAAAPDDGSVLASVNAHGTAREAFVAAGAFVHQDDPRKPRAANDDWPVASFRLDLGNVGAAPSAKHVILAYDDEYSIRYLGENLRPWWRKSRDSATALLKEAEARYPAISAQAAAYDRELEEALRRAGGEAYARLATLAFRQSLAAHKLVAAPDGTPFYFSKENFSNGCIGTVDVIYPAAPIYLLFNPALMRASLEPVLRYAALPRWPHPFAPHDLGTYPHADGQVYGDGEKGTNNQMPVEESGNMLLMLAALAKIEGKADLAGAHWPSLTKWAAYLKEKGLDPENQLCTDDFAGHLAHNVNLSLKAILALEAYASLADRLGKGDEAKAYHATARAFAAEWARRADDGDHYRLTFDRPGTWSQKYNLVWDRILGFGLFPPEVARKEIAYYLKVQDPYGIALDSRQPYTKIDWLVWSATLAERRADFEALVAPAWRFACETPQRVPLTDWYWTREAKHAGFQARSVVGGIFVKMLADEGVWKTWAGRGKN